MINDLHLLIRDLFPLARKGTLTIPNSYVRQEEKTTTTVPALVDPTI